MITILLHDPQQSATPQELTLHPEVMPEKGCVIGRSSASSLVLDSLDVSRIHAKITHIEGQYYFWDLASSGGSVLNQQPVNPHRENRLQHGDAIEIGRFKLEITGMGDPSEDTILHLPPEPTPAEYMPVYAIPPAELTRWQQGNITLRCAAIIPETVDVKTFRFVSEPPVLFTYKPGQFVTLELEIDGEEVLRSYSISSTPSRPHTLEITVKRVPPAEPGLPSGLVSNWLHDNIKVGSEVKLSGPFGKFTCFQYPRQKLLFISGGSGITPMMGMSRWLCDTVADCDIVFVHSAKTPADIIYNQEILMMAARHPNFQPIVTITDYKSGHGWMGARGRLSPGMIKSSIPDFMERMVFVCGPAPFMEATKTMMQSLNFPQDQYHEESFGVAKKTKKQPAIEVEFSVSKTALPGGMLRQVLQVAQSIKSRSSIPTALAVTSPVTSPITVPITVPSMSRFKGTEHVVMFKKSDQRVVCDGEESILEVAEQNGVKIRSSCRSGACGTCKKKKISGEVKMTDFDDEALEPSEQSAGYILTCVAFPVGEVAIEA
jgi:glycine betaine catabolism B